jgi:hypothetical protein
LSTASKVTSAKVDWIAGFCALSERQDDYFVSIESAARILSMPQTQDEFTYNMQVASSIGWAINRGGQFEFPSLEGSQDILCNFPIEDRNGNGVITAGKGIQTLRDNEMFQGVINKLGEGTKEERRKFHNRLMESKVTSYIVNSLERTPGVRKGLGLYISDPARDRKCLGFRYLRVFKDSAYREKLKTDPVFTALSSLGQSLTRLFGENLTLSNPQYSLNGTVEEIHSSMQTLESNGINIPAHIKELTQEAEFLDGWDRRRARENLAEGPRLPHVLKYLVEELLPAKWSGEKKGETTWQAYSPLLGDNLSITFSASKESEWKRWSFKADRLANRVDYR